MSEKLSKKSELDAEIVRALAAEEALTCGSADPNVGEPTNITSGDVDWDLISPFEKILTGNTTLTFSNVTDADEIVIFLTQTSGNSYGVNWPVGITWAAGVPPYPAAETSTKVMLTATSGSTFAGSFTTDQEVIGAQLAATHIGQWCRVETATADVYDWWQWNGDEWVFVRTDDVSPVTAITVAAVLPAAIAEDPAEVSAALLPDGPFASQEDALANGITSGTLWESFDGVIHRMPPSVTNVAIFGDSRASQTGSDDGVIARLFAHGIGFWMQARLGFKLELVRNSADSNGLAFAEGGQTWATLNNDAGSYPRVAELLAEAPDGSVVCCYCGTNGIPNGASNIADAKTVLLRFKAAGLYPIFFIEPYFGASQTGSVYVSERDTYNAEMAVWCATNGIPTVDVKPWHDNGVNQSWDYMFQNDDGYIHPNIRGASIIGREFARVIESSFALPAFPVTYASTAASVSANRGWSTGAYGNGSSTGWAVAATSATLATTFPARTDGQFGKWARIELTDATEGGATSTAPGKVQLYCTLSGASRPVSGNYRAVCEIEVETWDDDPAATGYVNLRQISLKLTTAGGAVTAIADCGFSTSAVSLQAHTIGHRESFDPTTGMTTRKIAVITDPMTLAADNTHLAGTLDIYGNGVLKIGNLAILPVS